MRRILLYFITLCFVISVASCNDDYESRWSTDPDDDIKLEQKKAGRIVLAYCPYYAQKLPFPDALTHINYGFAEVYVKDNVYQGFKLQGDEAAFKKVVQLKQKNQNIKICLSFTHTVDNPDNAQDGGFSAIAANEEYRRQFAADCLAFLRKWSIDGIDLDWEFPGLSWSGAACDPANDVANYTLLVKQLRQTLGNKYLLTFAGYVMDKVKTDGGWKYIDIAAVEPYVDFINLMTYDMDAAPGFHSAVKSSKSYWDIERALAQYRNAGCPMNKIVLGIPFYARHAWDGANSVIDYKNLSKLGAGYNTDNWDEEAQTPYITKNGEFFASYDNEKSINCKGLLVRDQGLKGMLYWDCNADDDTYTLARATWNAVMKD